MFCLFEIDPLQRKKYLVTWVTEIDISNEISIKFK